MVFLPVLSNQAAVPLSVVQVVDPLALLAVLE
jgi:hypothetical protein